MKTQVEWIISKELRPETPNAPTHGSFLANRRGAQIACATGQLLLLCDAPPIAPFSVLL